MMDAYLQFLPRTRGALAARSLQMERAPQLIAVLAAALCGASASSSALAEATVQDFKRMSLEELMEVEVFSASRRLEPSHISPSAIFVLTNDTIRRSRVTSIPEALRLVPGVQVGRVDANKWAVSMRGFNGREANKLLVLMDGRTIYDPLFSGVLWESQDVMLEDIDRIEVIRGPGGTLWGANAFSGIINIITKNSRDTLDGLVTGSIGDEERYTGAIRYGFEPARDQSLRFYAKSYGRDTGHLETAPPHDSARMTRGGFRWDWAPTPADNLRVSGDFFNATTGIREDPVVTQDVEHDGRNVLMRWNRNISATSAVQLQLYYDHILYESFGFDQKRTTYDLEINQNLQLFTRHGLVWGAGFRRMSDDTLTAFPGFVDVLPPRRNDEVKTMFAQDTIGLIPDRLHLILGLKYESTDYAESDWLPNVRFSWTPNNEQTWWLAVSEAARTPSRLESDLTFFTIIRLGEDFGAEHVRAYEAGQRQLLSPQLWYDMAVFYNDYSDLRSSESGGRVRNLMKGYSYGFEFALRFEPTDRWQLDATYTYFKMLLDLEAASTAGRGLLDHNEGLSPPHQVSLRSALDLPHSIEIDTTLRYVDDLKSLNYSDYTELDLGVTWRPVETLEFSVVGQNLLHEHHAEQAFAFSATGVASEAERRVYAKATWMF